MAGPLSTDALPQIFAGGELGHDPLGAGGTDVLGGWVVVVVGGAVVVAGAVVTVGFGAVVVGFGAVVVGCGAGAVVVGAVVVGFEGGAVVAGVVVGAGLAVVVGEGLVVGCTPLFATANSPRRLEVLPSAQVSTTLMRCVPSASFVVSYGRAVPSRAVPARSKGARLSVRTGGFVRDELSR
ncbi:MAG: hypothetical protein ACJ72M_03605 [Propionibacteriaceae bacterium]